LGLDEDVVKPKVSAAYAVLATGQTVMPVEMNL
jgi:hypothetical protein